MSEHHIAPRPDEAIPFRNRTAYCVGTGRLGLALHQEYQDQLKAVQALCGFQHIRGHGIFHEDLSIYQPQVDADGVEHEHYCFTYLDRVMDSYLAAGLKPFLELGFMPKRIASGEQTLFYWAANTTPPADEGKWVRLVQATLTHLAQRYGAAEVSTWPVEVWNEPNLPGFWENADKPKYLRLYEITAPAVKAVLPDIPVGGPVICGGEGSQEWIRDFLTFCREKALPVDFVSRHAYMAMNPTHRGRYIYHEMGTSEGTVAEMRRTREIIDSFEEYRHLPLHITEFNTSYNPFCPIHDTNENAAVMAELLSRLGDVADSYSYWTFGDVFEEMGVPSRLFHGGFGMMAAGCIPKPTLWTFAFYTHLEGDCIHRDAHCVINRQADGSYAGIAWNRYLRTGEAEMTLRLTVPGEGRWLLLTDTVDEETCNPLGLWDAMGQPATLTAAEEEALRRAATPLTRGQALEAENGTVEAALTVRRNGVVRFTLRPAPMETDLGYDLDWYRSDRTVHE